MPFKGNVDNKKGEKLFSDGTTSSSPLRTAGDDNSPLSKTAKRKCPESVLLEEKKIKLRSSQDSQGNDPSRNLRKSSVIERKSHQLEMPSENNLKVSPCGEASVLDGMDEEIDAVLEETADKNKLTTKNVKNILRHIITNEYVLAMVRNTMKTENSEGEELEEAVFEPKLTRSKAKELLGKQHTLPWPVSSPIKQTEPVTKKLLEEEFPEESSSDEDYKPNEEELPSEDEDIVSSPKCGDLDSSLCKSFVFSSPVSKPCDDDDDEHPLVIALPEAEEPLNSTEADKIALRTRSKLCLNDTPLEAIEASFVAPDITVDMYDTKCDDEDWQKFLRELSKPIDTNLAVEQPGEEPDDGEDDPEYNVLEDDDDIPDDFDLRYDNTVKITRKELNALMAEILDSAQQDFNDFEEEEDDENIFFGRAETPCVTDVGDIFIENVRSQWMTTDERLQLEEQMRMYVQLLTQSFLLSFGIPEFNFINISAKLFLDEIKMFASRDLASNSRSAFYSHNLDGAIDIVNDYENHRKCVHQQNWKSKKTLTIHSSQVRQTLASNKVFIYPELLPVCDFRKYFEKKKTTFTAAEDNLIALGLEQFSFCKNPVYYVKTLLVPSKTEQQIKFRIKNSRCLKVPLENPIKFYHVYKQAPQFQRIIRLFDPENVKAPKEYPPDILPNWMRPYCKSGTIGALIAPSQTSPPKSVSPNMTKKPPRKLCPILPRVMPPRAVHFSPLKQISPILRKYNQQRRSNSSRRQKSVGFSKRQSIKPRAIKPKIASISNNNNLHAGKEAVKVNVPDLLKSNVKESNKTVLSEKIANVQNHITHSSPSEKCPDGVCIENNSSTIIDKENSPMPESFLTENVVNLHDKQPSLFSKPVEPDAPLETENCYEADEEGIDDEQDLAALMAASSTICRKQQSVSKKRNRLQRDLESSLNLLQPKLLENDPKKEEKEVLFANSYLLRVTEALKGDPETYEKFIKALCKYQHSMKSPVKLYCELKEILKDHPILVEDFVAFLRPEQAKDCGKYKEYTVYYRIREFLRKVEVHFSTQPQHILRILRTFAHLRQQTDITSAEALSALQPLLRNQSHLIEELTHLLPDSFPPEYLMTDFEDLTIPGSDDDNSSIDSCEEVAIPDVADPYGGKDCPCDCHSSSTEARVLNKSKHCVKCGIKFIDGRIYIQAGKVLKPAQLTYHELVPHSVKEKTNNQQILSKMPASSRVPCSASDNITARNSAVCEQIMKPPMPTESMNKQETCVKKDPPRSNNGEQFSSVSSTDEPLPSTSRLPCDVIEDTVFPAVTGNASKSIPADFSHIKDMINNTKEKSITVLSDRGSKKNSLQNSKQLELMKKGDVGAIAQNHSSDSSPNAKWSRDEDKVIIYNCQRFGISKQAFFNTAATLESRTAEEVETRFIFLLKLLTKEAMKKGISSSEKV